MAEMTARDRHLAALHTARAEARSITRDTPHRRDLLRHIHRMEKEMRIYDHYHTQRG